MKELKKKILRIFLTTEIAVFMCFYIFGSHGLQAIRNIKSYNKELSGSITVLRQEIIDLEQELNQWHTDSFYKEKIAREQLQMAWPDEELYKIAS